jgi:pimeloyl-ACP methyl ester carboxylesterase
LVACIFLAVGPPKLGTPFNVDAINAMTKQQLGCEMLGYIPFIARHPLAQALMEKNCESVMGLLFCSDEGKEWKEHFRPLGAFEKFVTEGQTVEVAEWFGGELREAHLQAFGCQGGYAGAKGWYGMWDQELFMQDELGNEGAKIEIPSLFVGGAGDTDVQSDFLSEWVTNLTVEKVKSGHWVHIERPEKVNKLIADFLHQQDILIAGLFN